MRDAFFKYASQRLRLIGHIQDTDVISIICDTAWRVGLTGADWE